MRRAHTLGQIAYWLDRRGRIVALENLALAFPDKPSEWHRGTACRSYQTFARTFLSLFWSENLGVDTWKGFLASQKQGAHSVTIEPQAEVPPTEPALRTPPIPQVEVPPDVLGQITWPMDGVIICTLHFGQFEWLTHFIPRMTGAEGASLSVVAQDFKNPDLTPLFAHQRSLSGARLISSEGAMIRLFKALKRGGNIAFLSDLTLHPTEPSAIIRCFGKLTCVPIIHSVLAARTGRPIVPLLLLPLDDGKTHLVQLPIMHVSPDALPQDVAQTLWDNAEPYIRQHPHLWMWMYKHWRYRPLSDPAGETYPSYANTSKSFDKRLKLDRKARKRWRKKCRQAAKAEVAAASQRPIAPPAPPN